MQGLNNLIIHSGATMHLLLFIVLILLYDNVKENVVQMYKGIKEMIDD